MASLGHGRIATCFMGLKKPIVCLQIALHHVMILGTADIEVKQWMLWSRIDEHDWNIMGLKKKEQSNAIVNECAKSFDQFK